MSANLFGQRLQMMSFGESHGSAMGVVIDGLPAGIVYDEKTLLHELDRRRPGSSATVTARNESDQPEILSGIFEGKTLGTPIAVIIRNQDARSQDYTMIASVPRAGHADDVWKNKFGHSDPRGGGRSSGRETVSRVIGGAFAKMHNQQTYPQMQIESKILRVGDLYLDSPEKQNQLEKKLIQAKENGESFGGEALLQIKNPPSNLGQPVFHKLKSDLAGAFMSIGAVCGVRLGQGDTIQDGTQFHSQKNQDQYGGIRGGISTGETIEFIVEFKPTSSILDVAKKGRHDPCIIPRALPVLEAVAHFVIADHILWQKTDRCQALFTDAGK